MCIRDRSKLLIAGLALILMAYTGARSVNFIQATLPADRQILAFFALACLEGGMLGWLLYFLKGSEGAWQKGIAVVMTVIDFAGSTALFTADTLYESAQAGLTTGLTPDEIKNTLLALSGVIAINVGGKMMCWAMDPKARKERAQTEAFDKIDDLALEKISAEADRLAEELANQMTAAWKAQTQALYSAKIARLGAGEAYSQPIDAEYHDSDTTHTPRKKSGGLTFPWQKQPQKTTPDNAALMAELTTLRAQLARQPQPTYTPVAPGELLTYAAETTQPPAVRPLDRQGGV